MAKSKKKTDKKSTPDQPVNQSTGQRVPPLRFDRANPWPVGSTIIFEDDTQVVLTGVSPDHALLSIRDEQGGVRSMNFTDWQRDYADKVEEVLFPAAATSKKRAPHAPIGAAKLNPADCGNCRDRSDGECGDACIKESAGQSAVGSLNPKSEIPSLKNPQSVAPKADMVMVPIDRIDASHNVRKDLGEPAQLQLQESMADIGQLEPIVVRQVSAKEFRLVAGGRRLEAARRAGNELVEAKLYRGVDDVWEAKARLAENVQRQDLNHVELAGVFGGAIAAGVSVTEVARGAHLSDDMVRRHLALLRLTKPVADLVASGKLPIHQAELIARVGDPNRQIELAEKCLSLGWNPGKKVWTDKPGFTWKEGDPLDSIMPMDDLRKEVAYALCGLASCGWLKQEEADGSLGNAFHPIEGRSRCVGCPDNTTTYADQPTLFAGIHPQGAATKGYCTNRPCYEHKSKAWEEVAEARRKEQEKQQAEAARKAKKAGLDVCEGFSPSGKPCGRIADAGEQFPKCKVAGGAKLCPACAAKAKKRDDRNGGDDSSYEAKRKRAEELARRFPWDDAQRLAAATYEHAGAILRAIEDAIVGGGVPEERVLRFLVALYHAPHGVGLDYGSGLDPKEGLYFGEVLASGGAKKILGAEMMRLWKKIEVYQYQQRPGVDNYEGRVLNVPASKTLLATIDLLEGVALAWSVAIPERPTAESVKAPAEPEAAETPPAEKGASAGKLPKGQTPADVRANAARNAILQGNKRQAVAAIHACSDAAELLSIQAVGLKGDWRRAAVAKRIAELQSADEAAREAGEKTEDEE